MSVGIATEDLHKCNNSDNELERTKMRKLDLILLLLIAFNIVFGIVSEGTRSTSFWVINILLIAGLLAGIVARQKREKKSMNRKMN